jgi:hypothetical protein
LTLHRRAGIVFVYAILATGVGGLVLAVGRDVAPAINIPAALLTASLVITALTTVRPPSARSRWLDLGSMLVALAVGLTSLVFGFQALANGGTRNGMPAFPFLMFAGIGLLAVAGDLRVMRSGRLRGASRLARHLWRMSFALFLASISFFPRFSRMQVIPDSVRPAVVALPMLALLVTMLYWLWRVRRRNFRVPGLTAADSVEHISGGA